MIGGAFAYFSDTETSTGNTFTAGTLNLQLANNGTSPVWNDSDSLVISTASGLAPGATLAPFDICLKNAGTVSGKILLDIDLAAVTETIPAGAEANADMTPEQFAGQLIVYEAYLNDGGAHENKAPMQAGLVIAKYGTLAAAVADHAICTIGGVNYPTIWGLSQVTTFFRFPGGTPRAGQVTEWTTGMAMTETVTLMFDPNAGPEYMYDGVNIVFIGSMYQYEDPVHDPLP